MAYNSYRKSSFRLEGSDIKIKLLFADSFAKRFLGLMGKKALPQKTGLYIVPCNSIHMCFMRFALDVLYVDKSMKIIKVVENLPPWLGLSICLKAQGTIEFSSGTVKSLGGADRLLNRHLI